LSPDGSVIGRAITIRTLPTDQEYVIVGVVSDGSQGDPRDAHPRVIYRPLLQVNAISSLNPNLLIETTDAATAASGVRQILADGGRDYAQEIISLEALLARAPATERMSATVAGAVGGIAVLLALVGVHGVLAYSVSRRTREIGVRVAVGANPATVARAIIREGFMLTLLGVAIGLPAAFFAARALRAVLFGISETDAITFVASAVLFLLLGAVAGILPARRAAAIDPAITLRAE
jgi:putative ABC transport system permease protein